MSRLRLDPTSPSGVSIAQDEVRIVPQQNGYVTKTQRLGELTDVRADAPTNGQALAYQSSTATWIPQTISGGGGGTGTVATVVAGTGITVNSTDPANPVVASTITQYTDALAAAAAPVQSVAGRTGTVTLAKADVGLGNVDNTSDATKNAATVTLTNKTISGSSNTLSNIPESAVTNLTADLAGKQAALTLTTTGTSGAATLVGATLNIPNYASGGTTLPDDAAGWLHDNGTGTLTWTTPAKADVGLGNVDNTSDATKNTAVATLTNKTLTSPVINTPTGIVKGDVGLGNVDNTSDATKNGAVATVTNKDLTSGTNTFPTFNQSTTGSAAKWTTPRTLAGNSVDGSANVVFANKFIAQGTADTGLSAAQFLGALSTGLLKNTTTTGVLSVATAGTDYIAPGGALGTPSSGTATNLTGLPVSTGISGLGTGVATFLATPSSANLATAVTDETGTGSVVFANTPTLTTPQVTGSASVASTPAAGNGKLFGSGTGAVRPHWINSSGTDETVLTDTLASQLVGMQAITTNTTPTKVKMQMGWSYIQGAGTNTQSKTITFPSAFTTVINIMVAPLGITTTTAPTTIGSFNAGYSGNIVDMTAYNITTTAMTVTATLDSSATLGTTIFAGFSWVAYGT